MPASVPVPLALLLGDDVYQDRKSGKWVIAGVFSQIWSTSFPAKHDKLVVFAQVTGISSPVDFRLRVEYAETGEPIFEVRGPIKAKSPLDVISLPVTIRKVVFPKQGKYWIQLMSGEEILIQAPLQLSLLEQEQPEGEE